jgi:hypothetical protein
VRERQVDKENEALRAKPAEKDAVLEELKLVRFAAEKL